MLALVILCAASAVGAYALPALHAEVLWLSSTLALQQGDVRAARDSARRALALRPQQYRYLDQAALAEEAIRRPQHARRLWINALEQRPGWPYPWARIARWQLDYGDAAAPELAYSLTQVMHLGRQERGLWKAFAIEGLQHWHEDLPAPVRGVLRQLLLSEAGFRRSNLGGYALVRRQEGVLCSVLEQEEGPQEWCEQTRRTRQVCGDEPLSQQQRQWCRKMDELWAYLAYPP